MEEAVADGGDGDFVEFAGGFFAVVGDEGDGAAFGDEFVGGGDLGGAEFEFRGDAGEAWDGSDLSSVSVRATFSLAAVVTIAVIRPPPRRKQSDWAEREGGNEGCGEE